MAKEICISSTPHETRLAILEDDQLAEIYYERENEYTLAGSIYNGRVTRVLPGMQSAFVDIGLERDAFLYVTDFLELEDQEEAEELEKAATSGGAQAPREVRGGQRRERPTRERTKTAAIEAEEVAAAPLEPLTETEELTEAGPEAPGEPSVKRWRGRRRRRGRGGAGTREDQPQAFESAEAEPAETAEVQPEETHEIQATAVPARHAEHAPSPFVLPGEQLSKYGGKLAEEPARAERPTQPTAPTRTTKPSTLIETPIVWDGTGPLPGESLSRYRAPVEVHAEPQGTFADAVETTPAEATFVEELVEPQPEPEPAPELAPAEDPAVEEEWTEQSSMAPGEAKHTEEAEAAAEEQASDEPEPNAKASHHVDPLPPSTFRLFGLGGKKKRAGDEPAQASTGVETAAGEREVASVSSVSAFAPGAGLVEEEVIEGEEFETPGHPIHARMEEHDLDEYEEETIQTQIGSGDLGELLHEAHLDHRIQMDFDEKGVEEVVEEEAMEGEPEEEPAAEGQPRRERGGRGRRGRERGGQPGRRGPSRRSAQTTDLPIISDLLKPGQEILVQIAKEPIAKKGARITSHIALPGRFLVFMPTVSHVGVSRKIASDEERQRLKKILISERGEASGGFIVRTAAEGASEEELRADLRFLIHLWDEIKQRSESSKSPALIYHDLSLIERILRDQVSADFSSIWVDSEQDYERIVRFLNRFSPSLVRRVKLYTKETPLFEHFGIQDEISKALRSKVWLKSGGSIVINQTEALVAIDINTGKYVGKTARLEDTIVKTNLDAIPEIVRQIRLRDLGGIIIVDFIDMDERKNRFKVMAALEEALKSDRAPTKVLQFNDFGLVAFTRKRVKQSLERTLSVPCPVCQATGMVKSPTTVCNEIYIELRKMRRHFESADVLLRVNPETVKVLKANNARWLVEFEELVGKNILVKSDPSLHPEQFDIQG